MAGVTTQGIIMAGLTPAAALGGTDALGSLPLIITLLVTGDWSGISDSSGWRKGRGWLMHRGRHEPPAANAPRPANAHSAHHASVTVTAAPSDGTTTTATATATTITTVVLLGPYGVRGDVQVPPHRVIHGRRHLK